MVAPRTSVLVPRSVSRLHRDTVSPSEIAGDQRDHRDPIAAAGVYVCMCMCAPMYPSGRIDGGGSIIVTATGIVACATGISGSRLHDRCRCQVFAAWQPVADVSWC